MPDLIIPAMIDTCLSWNDVAIHPRLNRLQSEARQFQWDEILDIDWTVATATPRPEEESGFGRAAFQESTLGRYGESMWPLYRREQQAWMVSQFLHGEQGALVVSARLAEILPDVSMKRLAASQAAEEARHVAVFGRYSQERIPDPYAVSPAFEELLGQILRSRQSDLLVLGMQIMIESVALGAFRLANITFEDPLIRQITDFVARDETRHISFGVLMLDGLYDQMSSNEVRFREEFVLEAAGLLSKRYLMSEVWQRLGIDVGEGTEFARSNEMMIACRSTIFRRVVQTLKRVGLLSPKMREGFEQLGLLSDNGAARARIAADWTGGHPKA